MGGWFSSFTSNEKENKNTLLPENQTRSNTRTNRNTINSKSKIFEKIINIYMQTTCCKLCQYN
jgi:hypothetical protein